MLSAWCNTLAVAWPDSCPRLVARYPAENAITAAIASSRMRPDRARLAHDK